MNRETLYIIQLVGAVGTGGFIGEFYRTAYNPVSIRIFIANFLAGSFLSFFVSYMIYLVTRNRNVSLILGGLLSYQDEKFISNLTKKLVENIVMKNNDSEKGGRN